MRRTVVPFLAILILAGIVIASTPRAPLHLGRIWVNQEFDGAEGWSGTGLQYPGGILTPSKENPELELCRGWVGHVKKRGTYLFSTDWTDPLGVAWDHALSYAYRSYNYDYPTTYVTPNFQDSAYAVMSYVYPVGIQEKFRWERPTITLETLDPDSLCDTLKTVQFHPGSAGWDNVTDILPDHKGGGPRPDPIIDATLVTEEVIETSWRYIQGVELNRTTYGYPLGSPHQDYVIEDITLTNNGISGNVVGAPVMSGQTITNMVWAGAFDYRNVQAPSGQTGEDVEAMYIEPWGPGVHAAILFNDTDSDETEVVDWGDPAEDDYYMSHMLGNAHVLKGPLFVSTGAGTGYDVDDLAQPLFRMIYYERGIDITWGKAYSPDPPEPAPVGAISQRKRLTEGKFQLPLNTSYLDHPPTSGVCSHNDGPVSIMGYGTQAGAIGETTFADHGWDIPFGESVRIVNLVAAGGIDQEMARQISADWQGSARTLPTCVSMDRARIAGESTTTADAIALVKSGRDTAMKAAAMAYWNFYKSLPANVDAATLESWGVSDLVNPKPAEYGAYDVPDAPRPPGAIHVRRATTAIEVRWTTESEFSSDHDTGVDDLAGYRVWRQTSNRNAPWELIADGAPSSFEEKPAEGECPAGRSWMDAAVVDTAEYWYAVTAYDDGSQNWARPGKSLESARWWTWTGYHHLGTSLKGQRFDPLEKIATRIERNTPNPFNPVTTIKFALEHTTPVKIMVFNVAGQHVQTLVDGVRYAGVHNVIWNGRDAVGRECASGVYISRLITPKTTHTQKMLLIR